MTDLSTSESSDRDHYRDQDSSPFWTGDSRQTAEDVRTLIRLFHLDGARLLERVSECQEQLRQEHKKWLLTELEVEEDGDMYIAIYMRLMEQFDIFGNALVQLCGYPGTYAQFDSDHS